MRAALLCIALGSLAASCESKAPERPGAAASSTPSEQAQAHALWRVRCAACHGDDGSSRTPMGEMTGASDLRRPGWQQRTSDEALRAAITEGVVRAKDGRMRRMPEHEDLSAEQLEGLVRVVRGFGGR